MNQPTPGPWTYEPATKTIRSVPSNYWLASMDSWDGAVDHDANARLIAKAPEMLAALRDLHASCRNWAPQIDRSRATAVLAQLEGA